MPDGTLAGIGHRRLPLPDMQALDKNELDKGRLVNRIGLLIVDDPALAADDWDGYALIVRYGDGGIARRISGFRYRDAGGYDAATPESSELGDALDALRDATQVPGKARWDACVFRIRSDTRKVHVEFEYDAPERWDITPESLLAVVERARPA